MTQEREGKEIYKEGKIEVRTFDRDPEAHGVYINESYFLLQRGCLEQFAMRTPAYDLERALGYYNPSLPYILRRENITYEEFALVLSRAIIIETKETERMRRIAMRGEYDW